MKISFRFLFIPQPPPGHKPPADEFRGHDPERRSQAPCRFPSLAKRGKGRFVNNRHLHIPTKRHRAKKKVDEALKNNIILVAVCEPRVGSQGKGRAKTKI